MNKELLVVPDYNEKEIMYVTKIVLTHICIDNIYGKEYEIKHYVDHDSSSSNEEKEIYYKLESLVKYYKLYKYYQKYLQLNYRNYSYHEYLCLFQGVKEEDRIIIQNKFTKSYEERVDTKSILQLIEKDKNNSKGRVRLALTRKLKKLKNKGFHEHFIQDNQYFTIEYIKVREQIISYCEQKNLLLPENLEKLKLSFEKTKNVETDFDTYLEKQKNFILSTTTSDYLTYLRNDCLRQKKEKAEELTKGL